MKKMAIVLLLLIVLLMTLSNDFGMSAAIPRPVMDSTRLCPWMPGEGTRDLKYFTASVGF